MNEVSLTGLIDGCIEQKLLATHTAFLAEVAHIEDGRASVVPLAVAGWGEDSCALPVLAGLPVLRGAAPGRGDVVLCVACERDISAAVGGRLGAPGKRRHSLTDSVVVGVIGP